MTANEAEEILKKAGVPDYYYRIRRPYSTECTVLEKRKDEWVIFFWERGQENSTEYFSDENSAVNVFLEKLLRINEMTKKKYIKN